MTIFAKKRIMILEQDKLDVINKKTSNIFNWRGQFTPEFVDYLLDNFGSEAHTLLDPFSGSGTVLFEASKRNLTSYGYEINPAAYGMSKFYSFTNLTKDKRKELIMRIEKCVNRTLPNFIGLPVYKDVKNYRDSYINLLNFASEILSQVSSKEERVILLNILFLSEKDKKIDLPQSITKSFYKIKKELISLPFSNNNIKTKLGDARTVGDDLQEKIDLIITSPPYINVFNYHQNYRAIVENFGFNILEVAHSEFGSNRKNRGNRFKTVIQYCIDMELAIYSFWKSLKQNGKMILVVGRQSNVRKTAFYNSQIIVEIIKAMKGFTEIANLERQFTNRFGSNIKEDIIIASKNGSIPSTGFAKQVALNHLKSNLEIVDSDVRNDIEDAINNIEKVQASPIFNVKNLIANV